MNAHSVLPHRHAPGPEAPCEDVPLPGRRGRRNSSSPVARPLVVAAAERWQRLSTGFGRGGEVKNLLVLTGHRGAAGVVERLRNFCVGA